MEGKQFSPAGDIRPASARVIIFLGANALFATRRAANSGKRTHLEEHSLGKDMVPKRLFFTKGVGKHKERLTSFELALRDAGIAAQNLVRV